VVAALLLVFHGSTERAVGRLPTGRSASQAPTVQVRLAPGSIAIPRSFLGVGVETSELSTYARAGVLFGRAIALMRPYGEPSMPLRVGGYSADEAYWGAAAQPAPPGVFEIDGHWMTQLADMARRDRLRVSLAVNLAVHSPSMAAAFARAASRALAPTGLAGVAIGDEPDLYGREPWFDTERVASTLASTPRTWTDAYSPASYRRDYVTYAKALRAAVPGVPLVGPEVARLAPSWVQALNGLGPLSLSALTVHRYPMSCRPPNSPVYPRIPLLLSARSSAGLAAGLSSATAIAHDDGAALVVSEINSASCAGPPGVTDSFAAALWAPDALFELLREGVNGVYWHVRLQKLNTPFALQRNAIAAAPELYGLALFAQMLGAHARLVTTRTTATPGVDIKAWAVRSQNGTSVLLLNKGPRAATVAVSAGGGSARLERLAAPSVGATGGITLAGRSIGSDARWHGSRQLTTVPSRQGTYRISVPPYSAALLTRT
jgi:hypothetical protein